MAILFYPNMKCLLINIIVFVNAVNSDNYKPVLLPQLPVGPYRLNFLGIIRCPSVQSNNKINFNLYLSKKSANTTEVKGNVTISIPFDDSLTLEFNMAVKDSIGGWKDNAYLYKTTKACSLLKMFLGDSWIPMWAVSGVPNATCPIPAGIYKIPGVDTSVINASNFPKTFFYGTYKFRVMYSKNNEVIGCTIIVMEIKRPWETTN